MRLTQKSDYGLRAMIALTRHYPQRKWMTVREISLQERIPEKFLVQILLTLKRAGLVRSRMGSRGGYTLARPPEEITFAEVIRVLDGPLAPVSCLEEGSRFQCAQQPRCRVQGVMQEVHEAVLRILGNTTFADVCPECLGTQHQAPSAEVS